MTTIDNTVCILNIGLERNEYTGPKYNTASQVFNLLEAYGIKNLHTVQRDSSTEPTLVIRCVVPSATAIYAVSSLLNQDCIATFNVEAQEGSLIGPKPEAWGEFDPAQFILLDGSLLSDNTPEAGEV